MAQGDIHSWDITPHRPSFFRQLPDMWLHRRLLPFFLRRAIVDLYSQTILGVAWLVIRPAAMVVAATLVIGGLLGVSTSPVPHLLFSLMSFAAWMVFARGMIYGTKSIIRNQQIMKQFYFPRIIVHMASAGPALVEGLIVFVCALLALGYFAFHGMWDLRVGVHTLLVVPSLLLLFCLMLGLSLVTTVLNSYARDTQYTVGYVLGAVLFLTPVFYPVVAVPEELRTYVWFNPLTPAMETFRWAIFHVHEPRWDFLALSAVTALLILAIGLWAFIRWEASALDAR